MGIDYIYLFSKHLTPRLNLAHSFSAGRLLVKSDDVRIIFP